MVLQGKTMGTTWSVKIARGEGDERTIRQHLQIRVEQILEDLNRELSLWDPASNLARVNAAASTEPILVDATIIDVFDVARQINERSGGAFDVSVLPLVDLWGFGPSGRHATIPDRDAIEKAKTFSGPHAFRLDPTHFHITKANPQCRYDLSGIAKGYAVDCVAEHLLSLGHTDILVEIGGEVRAHGQKQPNTPWRLGIERPDSPQQTVHQVVILHDRSMATSGDYRNFFIIDGKRYSHTIDPRTGWPVSHHIASVSVIHDSCMHADGWATALNVLGPEDGYRLAEREGLAAYFIFRTTDGYEQRYTTNFSPYLEKKP